MWKMRELTVESIDSHTLEGSRDILRLEISSAPPKGRSKGGVKEKKNISLEFSNENFHKNDQVKEDKKEVLTPSPVIGFDMLP